MADRLQADRLQAGRLEGVDVSVIVPMHDEEGNVAPLIEACTAALERAEVDYELVLVDDGSRDGTLERLQAASERDSRIHAIALRRRFGKGVALTAGISRARGGTIVTFDADLQEDPDQIPAMLQALDDGLDLCGGYRKDRRDSWRKVLSSRLFNGAIRLLARVPVRDINCGFKAMRREVAEELLFTGGRFRFAPLMAHWWGYRTGEIEVTHRPRERGRSHFGGERLPGAVVDLITVLCLVRYWDRPGNLFVGLGTLSGTLGFGVCTYILSIFVRYGNIQSRHPLLSLGVLLVVIGVQLVATGFLAEWFAYHQRSNVEPRIRWESSDDK